MRKMKYVIGILLLFLVIGFATVSVSLSISGNVKVISDASDFKVYFSNVLVNGKQDLRKVENETSIVFSVRLNEIGSEQVFNYDVTNASKLFDASLSINCTQGDESLSIVNEFDTSVLPALTTRTGVLTVKKTKSNSLGNDVKYDISCNIVASPIERNTEGSGDIVAPVQPVSLSVGDIVSIEGENFNIISQTEETVTMLAQYNLGTDYRQSTTSHRGYYYSSIQSGELWEYTPGPKEIDIQTYSEYPKMYVNEYALYIQGITGSSDIQGDLITLQQLKKLGCTISEDYSYSAGFNCVDSVYSEWLVNGQAWWTRSAVSTSQNLIWVVGNTGVLTYSGYIVNIGQIPPASYRPIITVPINVARKYVLMKYEKGEEVSIGNEKFNVMSDNGTSLTLLSKYNLGTNYKQSKTANSVRLFSEYGWEYSPGPKEIDIQAYEGNAKTYVNEYVKYLKAVTKDESITGNIFTLADLKPLGCTFSEDYTFTNDSSIETCVNSPYKSWLVNGQKTWTRSAVPSNSTYVWMLGVDGTFTYGTYHNFLSIRPMVTISKSALE